MDFVIDSSVLASFLLSGKSNLYNDKVINSLKTKQAIAPSILLHEITNILKNSVTKNKVMINQAKILLKFIDRLAINIYQTENFKQMKEILDLSNKYDLSLSGSYYLFIAIKMNLPLATNDEKLVKIAKSLELYYM